jgi:GNAT superfamily N-acetyltransferase
MSRGARAASWPAPSRVSERRLDVLDEFQYVPHSVPTNSPRRAAHTAACRFWTMSLLDHVTLDDVTLQISPPLADAQLAELFRAAWPGVTRERFGAVLERSLCWVGACVGARLVGFVNVAWDGGVHGFLLDPTVHPEYRRRGLGLALVRCAAEQARQRGLEWLSVDYEPGLREFYRRCGFRPSEAGVLQLKQAGFTELEPAPKSGVSILPFEGRWQEPCRQLLHGLPEWFGMPSVTAAYIEALPSLPSWVATRELGGQARLAGFMTLTQPQPGAFELHVIAVARDVQRQGVGRALLAHAERQARAAQGRFLFIKTLGASSPDPFYARSRAFYMALGYQPLFESDRLWNVQNPTLILIKALG